MSLPLAVIGDVHGAFYQLETLLTRLQGRRLIFVGDYVNRGPHIRRTLDLLVDLKRRCASAVFLLGNHDLALLQFLDGALPFYKFAALGGIATIRSYVSRAFGEVRKELAAVFPEEHFEFMKGCTPFFETDDFVVSHCGIDPCNPQSRTFEDMVTGYHEQLFSPDVILSKLVICGHYSQASGKPFSRGNVVCLDTGCGTAGGPLTAMTLPEREFIQCQPCNLHPV